MHCKAVFVLLEPPKPPSASNSSVFVSQDSLDELEMDDYWKEVENITSSGEGAGRGEGGGEGEAQEEEQQKTPEGEIRCVQGLS